MDVPAGLEEALDFTLIEALSGRRARRFAVGACIPNGALAYMSKQEPMPLSELEQMMVLTAVTGNTGWQYLIPHNPKYAPHLPNYSGSAVGRTSPSAAGFATSEVFYTDDNGVYMLNTRDTPPAVEPEEDGSIDWMKLLEAHRSRIRKLSDGRLNIPREEPYIEGHNLWIANVPGSTLVMPVGDLAQHMVANLCYYLQNGFVLFDDINRRQIPGIERFGGLADLDNPLPLTFVEQWSLAEVTTELSCACYAGALMLQAVGLGGWIFNGLNGFALLGAGDDPNVPGLGFRYDTDDRWPYPNPTGIPGVFEGCTPPHYPNMRAAVDALVERKFGPGGPFNADTPGPYQDSPKVRGDAEVHSEEFRECVAVMAQYIYDTFGKFPGTVPSVLLFLYLQAHHLDLDFYDKHFQPGAYLRTHAEHLDLWHQGNQPE